MQGSTLHSPPLRSHIHTHTPERPHDRGKSQQAAAAREKLQAVQQGASLSFSYHFMNPRWPLSRAPLCLDIHPALPFALKNHRTASLPPPPTPTPPHPTQPPLRVEFTKLLRLPAAHAAPRQSTPAPLSHAPPLCLGIYTPALPFSSCLRHQPPRVSTKLLLPAAEHAAHPEHTCVAEPRAAPLS